MNAKEWHNWCLQVAEKLSTIEKSNKLKTRIIIFLLISLIISQGLILFYVI
jgi:hypothetical protein